MSEQKRLTTVVGSGISGLAAAWELCRHDEDVLVLEAADDVGGCVRTVELEGCTFECGPTSFPETGKHLIQMAEELGLADAIVNQKPAATNRLIYVDHRLHRVPATRRDLVRTDLFTPMEKLRILMERFVPRGPSDKRESVAEFFYRRFGLAPVRSLVDGFVCGIYAADARRLGMRSAFPVIHGLESKYGSIMKALSVRKKKGKHRVPDLRSFNGGLATLTHVAAEQLGPQRVKTGVRVAGIERREDGRLKLTTVSNDQQGEIITDRVLLAVPAETAGRLLTPHHSMLADLLFDVEYAEVYVAHFVFREDELEGLPDAFGYLVPRPQRMRTLAMHFTSKIFPDRAGEGLVALTGFIGGANDSMIVHETDESLKRAMLGELSVALGMTRTPVPEAFNIIRHTPGLPQLDVGHSLRIKAMKTLVGELKGIEMAGNFLGGVSLNDCVGIARSTARQDW